MGVRAARDGRTGRAREDEYEGAPRAALADSEQHEVARNARGEAVTTAGRNCPRPQGVMGRTLDGAPAQKRACPRPWSIGSTRPSLHAHMWPRT